MDTNAFIEKAAKESLTENDVERLQFWVNLAEGKDVHEFVVAYTKGTRGTPYFAHNFKLVNAVVVAKAIAYYAANK